MKLGILGLGNMGSAIIDGIIKNNLLSDKDIFGYDIQSEKIDMLVSKYGIKCYDVHKVCTLSDTVIIAVKPSDIKSLLVKIKDNISEKIVLSICAGININYIENIIGSDKKVVRAMPNTPLLIGEGASCIAFNPNVKDNEKEFILKLFQNMGIAIEINEKLLDAVTGLSGSGPAYVYLFIESLADGGVKAGLPRDIALKLATQTVLGSAKLLLSTGKHPAELKDMVTSPGGTTIEGLSVLEENSFRSSIIEAVYEATEKSKRMTS
ncbi:MAG: pyrroline-5-carboxylate reductase [Spirochaetota bacterium]|nr:pyrroline-5-carboxylate reductase [Spirochaetota bacterium]